MNTDVLHICIHMYTHVDTYVYTGIHMYPPLYTCIYMYQNCIHMFTGGVYICIHLCRIHMYTYVYMCTDTCCEVYTYVYICTENFTLVYTYVLTFQYISIHMYTVFWHLYTPVSSETGNITLPLKWPHDAGGEYGSRGWWGTLWDICMLYLATKPYWWFLCLLKMMDIMSA